MPRLDGLDVCRRLRAGHVGRAIPIIVVTGRTDPESTRAAFDAGANDYIAKPVEIAQLRVRLESAIEAAKAREAVLAIRETIASVL
jgi:DNA-binding response OmpR family regulator